jgi:mono/diheme cytochrome c family protein
MFALLLTCAVAASAEEMMDAMGEDVTYDHIKPILSESCYSCHGPDKQKGRLRLDSPGAIAAGGKNGPVVVAGDPDKSPLYQRISLPGDDMDVMPAKGDPLTPEQIEKIGAWIKAGAKFGDAAEKTVVPAAAPATAWSSDAVETDLDTRAAGMTAPDAKTIKNLERLGIWQRPLSKNKALIELDYSQIKGTMSAEQAQPLAQLSSHIAWLNCAGSAVTDDDLAVVARMKNLTRLHLERTAITDAGLAKLKDLDQLEYLNLYGTAITDVGLDALTGMKNLKNLYLWQTKAKASSPQAERLKKALPELMISFDD